MDTRTKKNLKRSLLGVLALGVVGCAGEDVAQGEGEREGDEIAEQTHGLAGTLGLKRDSAAMISARRMVNLPSSGPLPAAVDLSARVPSPGNQGTQGSCVGWAVGYAAKSLEESIEVNWSLTTSAHQFSPSWIYNQINGGIDTGARISDAMSLVVSGGADTLANFPYNQNNWTNQPNAGSKTRAKKFRAATWNTLTVSTDAFRNVLATGTPIVVGIEVFPDFDNLNTSTNLTYDSSAGTSRGGHAITIIGYDNARSAFRFVNSWGTGFGQAGFGWLAYSFITDTKLAMDAYVLTDGPNRWTNVLYDYDGDGYDDKVVYRGLDQTWYVKQSKSGTDVTYSFGAVDDVKVPADYDGDLKTDVAVWRPSNGTWYIRPSSGRLIWQDDVVIQFGQSGDITVPADYDGDGKADVALFRPSNGTWYYKSTKTGTDVARQFGTSSDVTVPADYDGDGKTDIAVFRPSNGTWYYKPANGNADVAMSFGTSTDRLVPGDYDGDGKADWAIFRPSEGKWYVRPASGGGNWQNDIAIPFGASSDRQIRADFNGDGKIDPTVFRPDNGTWYWKQSNGAADGVQQFGAGLDFIPYQIP